jgi:hypothetical protein
LKLKIFRLENDITLLLVGCISFFKHEVQVMGQHIRFPLLVPKVICDDKLESKQKQCPLSLTSNLVSIQNTSYHEILRVHMVWIHSDFVLSSFKQMTPFLKGIHGDYKFFIMNFIINLYRKKLMQTKVNRMKKFVFSKLWKYGAFSWAWKKLILWHKNNQNYKVP